MNSVLVSILTQILSAILALFMPFTATAPAISVAVQKEVAASSAVATWDVSNSARDNVQMYYYEEGDNSFLDNVAAAISSVFAPISAYAAEEREVIDTVDNMTRYTDGTVVIDGSGATQEFLFLKWLNYETFPQAYEDWCIEKGYENEAYVARGAINEYGSYTEDVSIAYFHNTLPENYVKEEMYNEYLPILIWEFEEDYGDYEAFWRDYALFAPRNVVIQGNVTEISFYAFAFCNTVKDVKIGPNVQTIAAAAFAQTGISKIIIPANVRHIGDVAFVSCDNLEMIYIKGTPTIGEAAFEQLPDESMIFCENKAVFDQIVNGDPSYAMTASENDEEPVITGGSGNYSYTTDIVFNEHLRICDNCGEIYFDLDGHVCE